MDRANFRTRTISAVFIGAIIIGTTLTGFIPAALLVGLITLMSAVELMNLDKQASLPDTALAAVATLWPWIYGGYYWLTYGDLALDDVVVSTQLFGPFLVIFGAWLILSRKKQPMVPLMQFAFALLLFGLGAGMAIALIAMNSKILLGVFVLLWASDVVAYLVGSAIGKTRLAPHISPGKTMEGVLGGITGALLAAWLLSYWIPDIEFDDWLIIGALVAVFGITGDLIQSMVKRYYGAKDSGKLIPGHGGFWDRFDSFFGCITIVSIYIFH